MQTTGPYQISGGATLPLPLPSAVTSWRWLILANQSGMPIMVSINGTRSLQPWTADMFDVSGGPYITVTPQGLGTGSLAATWYGPFDPVPGGYPTQLANQSPVQIYSPTPSRSSQAIATPSIGNITTVTVTFGIGANAGDIGLVVISAGGAGIQSVTAPTGWYTAQGGYGSYAGIVLCWKVLTASDIGQGFFFQISPSESGAHVFEIDALSVTNAIIGNTNLAGMLQGGFGGNGSSYGPASLSLGASVPAAGVGICAAVSTTAMSLTDSITLYANNHATGAGCYTVVGLKMFGAGSAANFAVQWTSGFGNGAGAFIVPQ